MVLCARTLIVGYIISFTSMMVSSRIIMRLLPSSWLLVVRGRRPISEKSHILELICHPFALESFLSSFVYRLIDDTAYFRNCEGIYHRVRFTSVVTPASDIPKLDLQFDLKLSRTAENVVTVFATSSEASRTSRVLPLVPSNNPCTGHSW